jgi:FlaA1/EpsC-like NDP-sugar epimerase
LINIIFVSLSGRYSERNWFQYWANFLIILLSLLIMRSIMEVYRNVWRYPNVRAYLSMVVSDASAGVFSLLFTLALDLMGTKHVYLGFWQTFFIIALFNLSTLILRFLYQLFYQYRNMRTMQRANGKSSVKKVNIAIIGAGQLGCYLAEELRLNPATRYKAVCFIDRSMSKIGLRIADLDVYAEDEHITEVLANLEVQEIFVTIPHLDPTENRRLIEFYSNAGYRVKRYETSSTAGNSDQTLRGVVREFRYEDLLGRESLEKLVDVEELTRYYRGRTVLVTGGGGSIGSELCRQIASHGPSHLIILDIYENNAYDIQQELRRQYGDKLNLTVEIASVRDVARLECIFKTYRPEVVFHAAAHKHVPLMEHSACEAIKNNVFGTYNTANMAEKYGCTKFVLISTDKAVNPTNVMGASKRLCEMVIQCRRDSKTDFAAVRFGNVLGSNGSVVPLFRSQIERGGPVTITDKRIIRYFMTIPEATGLVMLAGSMAEDGDLFVLNMGKPVRILDMAENMIRLMGYTPYADIDIQEIGLRPGEKLYEELLIKTEGLKKTDNSRIFVEVDTPMTRAEVEDKLTAIRAVLKETEQELASPRIKEVMKSLVPTFHDPDEVNRKAAEAEEMQTVNGNQTADDTDGAPVGV